MIFSIRQLQEKCREQRQPLYIAFVDRTKAFDLVSGNGLFTLFTMLQRIICPPKLLKIITYFHEDTNGIVEHDGSSSDPFLFGNGVKQGCVLAPTPFGICSPCYCPLPSIGWKTGYISSQEVMGTFSTSYVCKQKPKCVQIATTRRYTWKYWNNLCTSDPPYPATSLCTHN